MPERLPTHPPTQHDRSAAPGLCAGARIALRSMWVLLTEDEVKLRLLQGSPIKYRPEDLGRLARRSPYHHAAPPPPPADALHL